MTLTNFKTGANGDVLQLDISRVGVINDGNSAAVGALSRTNTTILNITGQVTAAAGDEIFVVTGAIFANSALLETAIEATGARQITFASAHAANDDVIIAWSDGSDSYIGAYNDAVGATTLGAAGVFTLIATLVGVNVSVAGTLVSGAVGNFEIVT